MELDQVQSAGNLSRAGELMYGIIPDLEGKIKGPQDGDGSKILQKKSQKTISHLCISVDRYPSQ